MATIATLAVSLVARISRYEKGFKRASAIAKRFGRDIARHTRAIASMGLVAGAVAAGAIALLVKKQLGLIDSTGKLADVMGLTNEQLVGYQHGASIAGIAQEKFNSSLIRFSKSIADAEDGLSTPIKALDRLGLKFEDLQNLTKHDQLLVIADRFSQLGNQIDKDAALLNLFGRSGAAMGKFLEQGAAGIEAAMKEAERLGLTFNDIDQAQIEAANDAITRMTAIIDGAARVLTIQLAPFITVAAERFDQMATRGGGMGKVVFDAFQQILKVVAELVDWLDLVKAGWYFLQSALQHGAGLIVSGFAMIAKAIQTVLNLLPGFDVTIGDSLVETMLDWKSAAVDSFDAGIAAVDKFNAHINRNKGAAFFEDVKKRADEIARTVGKRSAASPGLSNDASTSKTTDFKQVDLSRMVLGGGGGKAKDEGVNESQGNRMIELMEQISTNTNDAGGGAAFAI